MSATARFLNWVAALVIALLISMSHLLGPDDVQTEQAVAEDLDQAVQTAQAGEVQR